MHRYQSPYFCNFEHIYREIGEQPPPAAKPIWDWKNQQAWIHSLSPDELDLVRSLTDLCLVQNAGN